MADTMTYWIPVVALPWGKVHLPSQTVCSTEKEAKKLADIWVYNNHHGVGHAIEVTLPVPKLNPLAQTKETDNE